MRTRQGLQTLHSCPMGHHNGRSSLGHALFKYECSGGREDADLSTHRTWVHSPLSGRRNSLQIERNMNEGPSEDSYGASWEVRRNRTVYMCMCVGLVLLTTGVHSWGVFSWRTLSPKDPFCFLHRLDFSFHLHCSDLLIQTFLQHLLGERPEHSSAYCFLVLLCIKRSCDL